MKMYRFLIALLFLSVLASPSISGNKNNTGKVSPMTLKGTIQDQDTREKLAGVSIYIESVDQKIYTDADGSFEIPALAPGTYTITFHCISYKDKKMSFDLQDIRKGKLNIGLEPVNP